MYIGPRLYLVERFDHAIRTAPTSPLSLSLAKLQSCRSNTSSQYSIIVISSSIVNACFNEAFATSFISKSRQHTCLLLAFLLYFQLSCQNIS